MASFGLLYSSYKNYNNSWGPILRPKRYDELVALHGPGLNCFYSLNQGRNYTASVVGNIVAQNFLNIESMTPKEIENICKDLIHEKKIKKDKGKYLSTLINEEAYYEEGEGEDYIAISTKEFQDLARSRLGKELALSAEDRIERYCEIPEIELIEGRVFDKKVSFKKVLDFVNFIYKYKNDFKEHCMFIIGKEVDTEILRYFFKNNCTDDFIKKAFAMDLLYGVFSDTCLLGGFTDWRININSLKSLCKGCQFHSEKEKTYGAMTFLEHIIANNKTNHEFKIFKDKLIELGIVERSFFASI